MEFNIASMNIIEFTRFYLAIFFTLVAAFYTLRIILIGRSTSTVLIFPGKRFCLTWWNHMAFRVFRAAIWMICLFRLTFPEVDNYLGLFYFLDSFAVVLMGNVFLTVGFIATIAIHISLGNEWRSGIDPNRPKFLLSKGVYQYSRHPMFLSIALSQLGFFMAVPSVFTLVCLIVGLYTLRCQALEEEKHLNQVLPVEYKSYSEQVPRWI